MPCRFGSTRSQVRILSPRLTFQGLAAESAPKTRPSLLRRAVSRSRRQARRHAVPPSRCSRERDPFQRPWPAQHSQRGPTSQRSRPWRPQQPGRTACPRVSHLHPGLATGRASQSSSSGLSAEPKIATAGAGNRGRMEELAKLTFEIAFRAFLLNGFGWVWAFCFGAEVNPQKLGTRQTWIWSGAISLLLTITRLGGLQGEAPPL